MSTNVETLTSPELAYPTIAMDASLGQYFTSIEVDADRIAERLAGTDIPKDRIEDLQINLTNRMLDVSYLPDMIEVDDIMGTYHPKTNQIGVDVTKIVQAHSLVAGFGAAQQSKLTGIAVSRPSLEALREVCETSITKTFVHELDHFISHNSPTRMEELDEYNRAKARLGQSVQLWAVGVQAWAEVATFATAFIAQEMVNSPLPFAFYGSLLCARLISNPVYRYKEQRVDEVRRYIYERNPHEHKARQAEAENTDKLVHIRFTDTAEEYLSPNVHLP